MIIKLSFNYNEVLNLYEICYFSLMKSNQKSSLVLSKLKYRECPKKSVNSI